MTDRPATFERHKSLQEIEGDDWGKATFNSHLVTAIDELRRKPLMAFSIEDLRIMIAQNVGLPYLIPMAIDRLECDPFYEGDLFPGDLLSAVLHVDPNYWASHAEELQRVRVVVSHALYVVQQSTHSPFAAIRDVLATVAPIFVAVSTSEERLVLSLRSLLPTLPVGADLNQAESFRDVLRSLEWFLPDILHELHPECDGTLDEIDTLYAKKVSDEEMELFGVGTLISDQATAPLFVRLQIATESDQVSWIEYKLGEMGEQGMVRTPFKQKTLFSAVTGRSEDAINWAYRVTYGQRRE